MTMMETKKERKSPRLWLVPITAFITFFLISVGLMWFLKLPWYFPFPRIEGLIIGLILLIPGLYIPIRAFKTLTLKRASGQEIYKPKEESKLITTGIYAYTRNPIYFGDTLLFLGLFFITLFTFLLIMLFLFLILFYFVMKWEEKELYERFGDEYLEYKRKVPRFIPRPKT